METNMMAKSQFHSFIYDHYQSYKKFFSRMDGSASLAFFEAYPSPFTLSNVSVEKLATLLGKSSKNMLGMKKAKQILDTVEEDGVTPIAYQEARDFSIQSIVRQLKIGKDELKRMDKEIESFLKHFDYHLTQMKGVDHLTAAKLIVEIGDITRFKNAKALAKYAGVAPVVYASGSSHVNYANRKGNRQLNELFYRLAIIQTLPRGKEYTLVNPIFHDYYNKKLSEGKTQRQAIKCVQRRLVNIIYNMMKHKQPYVNPPTRRVEKKEEN